MKDLVNQTAATVLAMSVPDAEAMNRRHAELLAEETAAPKKQQKKAKVGGKCVPSCARVCKTQVPKPHPHPRVCRYTSCN